MLCKFGLALISAWLTLVPLANATSETAAEEKAAAPEGEAGAAPEMTPRATLEVAFAGRD